MNKGTILFHKNFLFSDGNTGEKLIIILNVPKNKEPFLVCRTTSKSQFYINKHINKRGCYSDKNIYYIDANFDWFRENTWIQFYELFELDTAGFLNDHFKGNLEIKGCLRTETIQAIVNCIKKSEDVSNYHMRLLCS